MSPNVPKRRRAQRRADRAGRRAALWQAREEAALDSSDHLRVVFDHFRTVTCQVERRDPGAAAMLETSLLMTLREHIASGERLLQAPAPREALR